MQPPRKYNEVLDPRAARDLEPDAPPIQVPADAPRPFFEEAEDRRILARGNYTKRNPDGVDWEAVRLEVIAGTKKYKQIADEHGTSMGAIASRVKRARNEGDTSWDRETVKNTVKTEVGRRLAGKDPGFMSRREAKAITEAAEIKVKVIRDHRQDLKKIREIGNKLMKRLDRFIEKGDAGGELFGVKESPSDVFKKVGETMRHLIPLERQAFGILEDEGGDDRNKPQGGIVYLPPKAAITQPQQPEESPDGDVPGLG